MPNNLLFGILGLGIIVMLQFIMSIDLPYAQTSQLLCFTLETLNPSLFSSAIPLFIFFTPITTMTLNLN